jgi:hypothetical protein
MATNVRCFQKKATDAAPKREAAAYGSRLKAGTTAVDVM